MADLDENRLQEYRWNTFRTGQGAQLKSLEEAVGFVEERGFISFWPVKGIDLPSLWNAVAGDRPVPDEHDDPGHITWRWKDSMLDQKRWYYGKLLRRRATLVSMDLIPSFYALSERVGDLDDYMLQYDEGKLTFEERAIADALLKHGAMHTIELRKKAHLSSTSAKSRFERALSALQAGLWILPIGVAEAGAWRYAFIYELFDRWYPEVISKARGIPRKEAYKRLVSAYLNSVGVSTPQEIKRIFRWSKKTILQALQDLNAEGSARELEDEGWATHLLFD
jgi:hypothetical protein